MKIKALLLTIAVWAVSFCLVQCVILLKHLLSTYPNAILAVFAIGIISFLSLIMYLFFYMELKEEKKLEKRYR